MGKVIQFRRPKREYNLYELVAMAIKHDIPVDEDEHYTNLELVKMHYITALCRAGVLK